MIIYAIPGLGTTEKLFVNTKISNVDVVVLNWPLPDKNDNMQSYARKFLPQINTSSSFCLLGVSFGGMLCSELSKIISPQKTFLISSCKLPAELPWFLRSLKYAPVYKLVSEKQHRKLAYEGRWIAGFGKAYIPEFLGMINEMTKDYFKNCIDIIAKWETKELPINVVHIHGTNDRLLLYNAVKADYAISNGSHAMILFEAEQINNIIDKEIKKLY